MKSQIFLPEKIKVGLQKRNDTYTEKLGYVIYHDGKVWRKEASWEGWRDGSIPPIELDNTPTEGFVLNKKAGGDRYTWNPRQTYCRVYDPRGFEFEITIPNLLYILENTNSVVGKGLEGEFVYGWDKKDLVLIPVSAPEYVEMKKFTGLKDVKFSKNLLVPGMLYQTKDLKEVVYLGEFKDEKRKKLWFVELGGDILQSAYFHKSNTDFLHAQSSDTPHQEFPKLLWRLNHSGSFSTRTAEIKQVSLREIESYGIKKDRMFHRVLLRIPGEDGLTEISLYDYYNKEKVMKRMKVSSHEELMSLFSPDDIFFEFNILENGEIGYFW
jgi:hypothetical protein